MSSSRRLLPAYELVYALLGDDGLLHDAFDIADAAHDGQTRRTPTGRVPYLLHPLRVFFRLLAWGVTDRVTLAAALLHDTMEDAPDRVWQTIAGPTWSDRDQGHVPSSAWQAFNERFGDDVSRVVFGLTNQDGVGYIDHVGEATKDPRVLIDKLGDFWDNGMSLDPSMPGYERLRAKYAPMFALLAERLRESPEAQELLPAWREVLAALEARL